MRASKLVSFGSMILMLGVGAGALAEEAAVAPVETPAVAGAGDVPADAGVKGAAVTLREIRMADGLGGKGYLLFSGPVSEVDAAVEIGSDRVQAQVVASRVIAQIHEEMDENLLDDGRFRKVMKGSS
jgi:microcompartment protein CcmL/EutN